MVLSFVTTTVIAPAISFLAIASCIVAPTPGNFGPSANAERAVASVRLAATRDCFMACRLTPLLPMKQEIRGRLSEGKKGFKAKREDRQTQIVRNERKSLRCRKFLRPSICRLPVPRNGSSRKSAAPAEYGRIGLGFPKRWVIECGGSFA